MNKITIATTQFPVSGNIKRNFNYMKKLVYEAKDSGSDIVHFPEVSLGGYAGTDFISWKKYNWEVQNTAEDEIIKLADSLDIGIIYGSNHKNSDGTINNSLVYVSNNGETLAGYDKRFCTERDLKYYTPGKHFSVFTINGFKCGMLICYDLRFPELYREYRKMDIKILFQSFYNARSNGSNIHSVIMRPTLQARAATNYFFISASNASGFYQSWASVFIEPDGVIKSSCLRHRSGLVINSISETDTYYDAGGPFRNRALSGVLYSG